MNATNRCHTNSMMGGRGDDTEWYADSREPYEDIGQHVGAAVEQRAQLSFLWHSVQTPFLCQ